MPINANQPQRWKSDIAASVDMYNRWFMKSAPAAFRKSRQEATQAVVKAVLDTNDLADFGADALKRAPGVLPILRMATCPPLARDRLVGLAGVNKSLVKTMEEGQIPLRMPPEILEESLGRMVGVITKLLDHDILPWLEKGRRPTAEERHRASTIVADRRCGALPDPIIRNAQERRQLELIEKFLRKRSYKKQQHPSGKPLEEMKPGTFCFRLNVAVGGRRNRLDLGAPNRGYATAWDLTCHDRSRK